MTVRRMAIVLGLLAFVLPALSVAQGLGDAAAREKAKREAAKKASETKVLTNEDLDKGRPPGSTSPSSSASREGAPARDENPSEASSPSPMEDRLANERPYLDALQAAQTHVAQIEQKIQELRSKLNPMSSSFIYGGTSQGDLVAEEARIREELTQAEGELNEARQAVAAANQALQDFKQGRASAPPVAP